MFGMRSEKAPYGWRSYRRNLIVLYESLGKTDPKIDALIEETKYEGPRDGLGLNIVRGIRTNWGRAWRPDPARQWAELNEMELRLFHHLDDAQLVAEMERKFAQAEHSKLPGLRGLKTKFQAIAGDRPDKRAARKALAFVFLEEMFVKYSYRFSDQEKRKEVSRRLTVYGALILGPIILGLFFGLADKYFGSNTPPPLFAWLEEPANLFGPVPEEVAKAPLGMFFIVAYSGIVGAYFSRLFGYVSKMESLSTREMDVIYSGGALSVRLLVGAIGALILFFLMMGNLLQGEAFPEIKFSLWRYDETTKTLVTPLQPSESFAKLVVWSIVAGFFERFVPDRLEKAKQSANGSETENASPAEGSQ